MDESTEGIVENRLKHFLQTKFANKVNGGSQRQKSDWRNGSSIEFWLLELKFVTESAVESNFFCWLLRNGRLIIGIVFIGNLYRCLKFYSVVLNGFYNNNSAIPLTTFRCIVFQWSHFRYTVCYISYMSVINIYHTSSSIYAYVLSENRKKKQEKRNGKKV